VVVLDDALDDEQKVMVLSFLFSGLASLFARSLLQTWSTLVKAA
jgi:hypothetical protein